MPAAKGTCRLLFRLLSTSFYNWSENFLWEGEFAGVSGIFWVYWYWCCCQSLGEPSTYIQYILIYHHRTHCGIHTVMIWSSATWPSDNMYRFLTLVAAINVWILTWDKTEWCDVCGAALPLASILIWPWRLYSLSYLTVCVFPLECTVPLWSIPTYLTPKRSRNSGYDTARELPTCTYPCLTQADSQPQYVSLSIWSWGCPTVQKR